MTLKTLQNFEHPYVAIDHENNTIKFKIQDGQIKDVGINGCQVNALIEVAHQIIVGLNVFLPCQENRDAIQGLSMSLDALMLRKINHRDKDAIKT